jgi:hypothetical protein
VIHGVFHCRLLEYPDGPVLWEDVAPNRVTNQGLAYLANTAFGLASVASPFYAGLISNIPTPTLTFATDTFDLGGHSGWTEFTGYSNVNRALWTPAVAASIASPILANAGAMILNINAGGTLYGAFLVNVAVKATPSSPTATLLAEAAFADGLKTVSNGNVFQFSYSLNMHSTF